MSPHNARQHLWFSAKSTQDKRCFCDGRQWSEPWNRMHFSSKERLDKLCVCCSVYSLVVLYVAFRRSIQRQQGAEHIVMHISELWQALGATACWPIGCTSGAAAKRFVKYVAVYLLLRGTLYLFFYARLQNCEKPPLASSCLSVCPTFRMEQLVSWTEFCIWYTVDPRKSNTFRSKRRFDFQFVRLSS
jgi:hypothetical protein